RGFERRGHPGQGASEEERGRRAVLVRAVLRQDERRVDAGLEVLGGVEILGVRRFRAGRSRPLDLRPGTDSSRPAPTPLVRHRISACLGVRLSSGPIALSPAGGSIAIAAGKSWWIHPQETSSV